MATSTAVLSVPALAIALEILPGIRREDQKRIEEYEAECREWAKPKFGAPHGYRPHYCIHGTNDWTDYDNICWGCEEYGYNNLGPAPERALHLARVAVAESQKRKDKFYDAALEMVVFDYDLAFKILDLCTEPVKSLLDRYSR